MKLLLTKEAMKSTAGEQRKRTTSKSKSTSGEYSSGKKDLSGGTNQTSFQVVVLSKMATNRRDDATLKLSVFQETGRDDAEQHWFTCEAIWTIN